MPRMATHDNAVDSVRRASVSFAPSEVRAHASRPSGGDRPSSPVRPERVSHVVPEHALGAQRDELSGFPIQAAKVQRPPLRDDVLARDRLLDWLHLKIHHRLVLVLAEAGYGKTTLLADFAGRTRLRTLWYRLDEDDRDWVTLLHHLVASGREQDPDFAPRTGAMLSDSGVAGPPREAVLDMFLRELPSIAEHGVVLILDDVHLVDDAPDVRFIARELVMRAPERVTIVMASRRTPSLSIAKLRAAGEVVELRTDDLRFDRIETARLFSETYGRPLEPDVLADLSARTEGWAASLQLVQAALRDRSPAEIRRFVRNLTGADQELYDYLAEEVVGELPDALQQFLMQTSILQVVTPDLAEAVTGLPPAEVRSLTATAERFSLLGRRGSAHRDQLRYHPLVRGFLEARLERSTEGRSDVLALHRAVATATEGRDWRVASHHYAQMGDERGIVRTIDSAVEEIVARGDVLVAEAYLADLSSVETVTSHEVIRSRSEIRRGEHERAMERAMAAHQADPTSPVAMVNLASVAYRVGDFGLAEVTARKLASTNTDSDLRAIGGGLLSMVHVSRDGDLRAALADLNRLRKAQQARGHSHYEGTTLLNIAVLQKMRGNGSLALAAADSALALLGHDQTGSEFASALSVRGWALANLGDLAASRQVLQSALADVDEITRAEVLLEYAEIELLYGSAERAIDLLNEARPYVDRFPGSRPMFLAHSGLLALRRRDLEAAEGIVDTLPIGAFTAFAASKSQQLLLRGYCEYVRATSQRSSYGRGRSLVSEAVAHATVQGADLWLDMGQLLLSTFDGGEALRREVRRLCRVAPSTLSALAEVIVDGLPMLGEAETNAVAAEIGVRHERWLSPLRDAVDKGGEGAVPASRFLEMIGTQEDVARLRRFSRRAGVQITSDLGRGLARRIADRVHIEDQGRVAILIGKRSVEGTAIRRKVLTLLCYLITRPRFSATRDEVLDTLWPDFDPAVALNSLNQTLYFLRRVLEPGYREDTSPGYVRHEADVVWLDRQLVGSRSQHCGDYMKALPAHPSPSDVERLVVMYQGQFALDFAYEEWAVGYRDALHASYLQVVETAVASDIATGHFARGIRLARSALSVDPEAEQIELSLLRLLRLSGAHAAAAEQYEHYSTQLRETFGIEPPPLDAL
jgi:ATP/maltotriose-dependent transcriptional regulator MalT/DNA-binding SARP family transcriptional activator